MALPIGEVATMRTIDALREAVLDELQLHMAVEIDCSAITEVDLTFLQLLEAARQFADGAGNSVTVSAPVSPALCALAARAGFAGTQEEAWSAFWKVGASEQ